MKDGFLKVAAMTPDVQVGDPVFNGKEIRTGMEEAWSRKVRLLVFPELSLTAYTCGDMLLHEVLLEESLAELAKIKECSKGKAMVTVVGAPFVSGGKMYDCAFVFYNGATLGIVPKQYIPDYGAAGESRYFAKGDPCAKQVEFLGETVAFGGNLLFRCKENPGFVIGCEVGEDLLAPVPVSTLHALRGAFVLTNCAAGAEVTGKGDYMRQLVSMQSSKVPGAYIYAEAGEGESTTDLIFAGRDLICENGTVLSESEGFRNTMIVTEIDLSRLSGERIKMNSILDVKADEAEEIVFSMKMEETKLTRTFEKEPFIPSGTEERKKRCEEILTMQALGLKKRLSHAGCRSAILGISGGLDSTLAVLVTARAFDMLDIPREKIVCVTMPCYGTTDRTYQNALTLTKEIGASLREINIRKSVSQHFCDIGHDEAVHDVTYENSQARERTQILMDLSNEYQGMVIGTGDMSELALGWATYNGDHMSMYGVNASVPKTLVRHLVRHIAETTDQTGLRDSLLDILDTPVSPELLPPVDGVISQKTEDLVGPYELHDFFLYYMLRFGYGPEKIMRIAKLTFDGEYDDRTIYRWLRTFCWRFFAQQFKRSCLPDGPKIGSVGVSPRGDLKLASDARQASWMRQLDELKDKLGIEA